MTDPTIVHLKDLAREITGRDGQKLFTMCDLPLDDPIVVACPVCVIELSRRLAETAALSRREQP